MRVREVDVRNIVSFEMGDDAFKKPTSCKWRTFQSLIKVFAFDIAHSKFPFVGADPFQLCLSAVRSMTF
jgi:hypothetical protein